MTWARSSLEMILIFLNGIEPSISVSIDSDFLFGFWDMTRGIVPILDGVSRGLKCRFLPLPLPSSKISHSVGYPYNSPRQHGMRSWVWCSLPFNLDVQRS